MDRHAAVAQLGLALNEALVAYRDLGLLSDAEADEWQALWKATKQPRSVTLPAGSSPKAVRLLEDLFEQIGPLDESAMQDHAALARGPYGRFMGALTVASITHRLSAKDADAWHRRLQDHIVAGQPQAVRDEHQRRKVSLADLQRVVPGPARRPSGLTVVSIELYADAFLVSWERPFSPPDAAAAGELRGPEFPEASVEDDVGTKYFSHGGGGGTRASAAWRGHTLVVPTPPDNARVLTVRFDAEEAFTVDLDSTASSGIR